jgi:phosphoribosyl 1,2-cyclic phosphodiesterase
MTDDNLLVTFWGVRGGYPMPGPTTVKYGGNTTCIEVNAGEQRIIIDGGTGIIALGYKIMDEYLATGRAIHATLLVTHTHHDHMQGFPFFTPTRHQASTLHIFGPFLIADKLDAVIDRALSPPVFPLGTTALPSTRILNCTRTGDTLILPAYGEAPQQYGINQAPDKIPPDAVVIKVHHGYHHPKSGVLFFRITYRERSVVIATDTEGFCGGDRKLINFARGADLLIHDAEYDEPQYANETVIRQGWGHSTWRMATDVAKAAQVKRLALTHHSPDHSDTDLEMILKKTQTTFPDAFLAREGETVTV